jgi:hypothetical protein
MLTQRQPPRGVWGRALSPVQRRRSRALPEHTAEFCHPERSICASKASANAQSKDPYHQIAAGNTRSLPRPHPKPVLLPQPIPLPNPRILRQPIPQLMRQHQNLPPMMRLMRKHVSEHRPSRRPRPRPTATPEFGHAPLLPARQGIRKHADTLRRALPVRSSGLSHRAPRRIQRRRTLQVRRRTLQPNQPAVMQMRKDRSNRPPAESASGQFRPPSPWIKIRHQPLIHRIVD